MSTADMTAWFSIPVGTVDHPTTAQVTAWEAAAATDFEGLTDVVYDSTVPRHQVLFRMLCANFLFYFYKTGNYMAQSRSVGGSSSSYAPVVPFYKEHEIATAVARVRDVTVSRFEHL